MKVHDCAKLYIASLVLVASLFPSGCISLSTNSYNVRFSPDEKTIAFAYAEVEMTHIPGTWFASGLVSQKVRICDTDRPSHTTTLRVCGGIYTSFSGYRYRFYVEDLVFSPDSKHLAILTTSRLLVLNLQSGRMKALNRAHENITSIAWTSDNEVAYCLVGRTEDSCDRTFCVYRQNIHVPMEKRIEVYHEEGNNVPASVVPSPDGRYVITKPCPWGQCRMVNVMTGKAIDIGPKAGFVESVAWRDDSSAVVCAVNRRLAVEPGSTWTMQLGHAMYMVEITSGSVSHLEPKAGIHPRSYFFASRWTADNRYVVIDAGWSECSLLDVQTQKLIALKDNIVKTMQLNGNTSSPMLAPFPVAGWLWTQGADGKSYAIDYNGANITLLAEEWQWAVSADGRRVAQVSDDGRVTIRSVNLPASRPARE